MIAYLDKVEQSYSVCTDLNELLRMDEEFHVKLASLSGNSELVGLLCNVNERIRYVRLINLRLLRDRRESVVDTAPTSMSAHRIILNGVKDRDMELAVKALRGHIERRSEQTMELVRVAFSQLYVPGA